MKPDFALSLSFEGIGLLHRAAAGWERVGEVPLDVADLPSALDLLKKTASELTDAPLNVKLVLPAEQIKYLRLSDPGGSDDVRHAAVRAALDGATPYTLDELSYDWAESGGEITVAAVAKETLAEAEGFARDNGFTPIYFAAMPAAGEFGGEPFFGEAAGFTPEMGALERDSDAVVITGVARPPEKAEPQAKPPEETLAEPTAELQPEYEAESGAEAPAPREETAPEPSAQSEAKSPETAPETVAPAAAFASRRSEEASESQAPALSGVTRHEPKALAPDIPAERASEPAPASAPAFAPSIAAPAATTPAASASQDAPAPIAPPEAAGKSAFFSRRKKEPQASAPTQRAEPSAPPLPTPPPNVIPKTQDERQRLTVFGARKPAAERAAVAGKPRFLGLILTAVLLVFLLGVAAWASIFTGEGLSRFFERNDRSEAVAALENPDELSIEGEEAMVPEEGTQLASLNPDLAPEEERASRVEPVPQEAMTLQEAQAKYAVTGIWALAPAAPQTPQILSDDDLYIASIDTGIEAQDAIALPPLAIARVDGTLERQANPAAQGQQFELDTRGLVIAKPEGAISPEGHMVFAGKPPYFPRELPDRSQVEIAEEEATPQVAAIRPKLRPGGLQEANERATLGGYSIEELAKIRPKLRPRSAQQIAEAAQPEPEPEPETPAAEEESVPQTPGAVAIKLPQADETPKRDLDPNATAQAVAKSVKPKNRPRNFSRIVKRAEQNKEKVQQVAAVAPRTVSPSIPSRSSVAKQATVRNAINLRRVNLIGVYGKTSSRRALVRLANGRYKKVKVGDRIDGGRVSAIGDGELRYQKGGRSVTLKMPRS